MCIWKGVYSAGDIWRKSLSGYPIWERWEIRDRVNVGRLEVSLNIHSPCLIATYDNKRAVKRGHCYNSTKALELTTFHVGGLSHWLLPRVFKFREHQDF